MNTHRLRPCELPTVNATVLFFMSETHKAQYAFLIQTAYKNVKTTHVCARACGTNINVWTRSKVACSRCTYITVIVTRLSCDHCVAIFIAQRSKSKHLYLVLDFMDGSSTYAVVCFLKAPGILIIACTDEPQ